MVIKSKLEEACCVEHDVEEYLKENKIEFEKNTQILSRFKPDFILNKRILLEVKWVDDERKQTDPPYIRNMLSQATFTNQLLQKIYPERDYKTVLILKRKTGKYSPTNILYGNMVFDLYLPFEYLDCLKGFLDEKSKEQIFFEILDDLFEKYWKYTRNKFPSAAYHFLLSVERGKYKNVSEFLKSENYTPTKISAISCYMKRLEKLEIIKRNKIGQRIDVSIINPKWRYFVYLVVFCKGLFIRTDLEHLEDMWNRIIKLFNI